MVVVLDDLYGQLDLIEVDDALLRRAVELAEVHALRGSDAIHLAAPSGSPKLRRSWWRVTATPRTGQYVGLSVTDTSASHHNNQPAQASDSTGIASWCCRCHP